MLFTIDDVFETCCNRHDICYDTCGSDRVICDHDFEGCLLKACKSCGSECSTTRMKGIFEYKLLGRLSVNK